MQNVKIRNYVSEKLVSSDRLIDVAGKCHSRIPFYFLNGYAFSPGSVVLLLTYRCNQRCKMCFYHEYYEDIKKREPNNTSKELCLDEIKGLIDDLSDINVPILSLHGGEPTLRKDFIEIINYAKEKCITIRFVTNGINIKNSLARDIVQSQNVDHITFSLHGPESVHDEIVGRTGAYRRLISGIEAITSEIEGDYTKPS
ncbi:MAG: radical SAM protein, partial [Thermotogota bacterium]|nr:radical SAM protein [Thermotogota bacterium]